MNVNSRAPRMNLNLMSPNIPTGEGYSRYIFLAAGIVALVILFALYYQTIMNSVQNGWHIFTQKRDQDIPGTESSGSSIPTASSAVQKIESDVEAALSMGGHAEVFNVSRNIYSFADAEPLCKAFGAELATYDQVKDAYEKGADWCNYGWSKGQLALYPTQEETWKKLQDGPEDQRMSCGNPGVNGGSFTNSEQKFGVNCYGKRPARTALDDQIAQTPQTPFDQDVARFKSELDTIPVSPWNIKRWSQS